MLLAVLEGAAQVLVIWGGIGRACGCENGVCEVNRLWMIEQTCPIFTPTFVVKKGWDVCILCLSRTIVGLQQQ